jgi:hypothetical protein
MKYYLTDYALSQGIVVIESDEPKEEISTVFGMTIPLEHIHTSREAAEKKVLQMVKSILHYHYKMVEVFENFKPFYYGEKR